MSNKIRPGGLFRCCIGSIRKRFTEGAIPNPAEGETMRCLYCSAEMAFRGGAWEWNRGGIWESDKNHEEEDQ